MKKLLLLSYAFAPLSVAGIFRILRFVKYLPEHEWETTVICTEPRQDGFHDHELLNEIPSGTQIYRTKRWDPLTMPVREARRTSGQEKSTTSQNRPPLNSSGGGTIGRLLRKVNHMLTGMISIPDSKVFWVPAAVMKGLRVHRENGYDAIMTTSPPHSSHLAGLLLAKLTKKPWVIDFRDPWIDHSLSSYLRKNRVRDRVEKWMERIIVKHADRVIANTKVNRQALLARYDSLPAEKFMALTNGFDKEHVSRIEPRRSEKFTICHTGIFYHQLNPYFFFEALAQWVGKQPDKDRLEDSFQVLLVGSRNPHIEQVVENLSLGKYVRFIERTAHSEALALAKGSDLLLLSLGFGDEARGWVPLKLYDYFGCERPILAMLPKGALAAEMIQATQTGNTVCEPDPQQVFSILDSYYHPESVRLSDNGYSPCLQELNRYEHRTIVGDLSALLDGLIDAGQMKKNSA